MKTTKKENKKSEPVKPDGEQKKPYAQQKTIDGSAKFQQLPRLEGDIVVGIDYDPSRGLPNKIRPLWDTSDLLPRVELVSSVFNMHGTGKYILAAAAKLYACIRYSDEPAVVIARSQDLPAHIPIVPPPSMRQLLQLMVAEVKELATIFAQRRTVSSKARSVGYNEERRPLCRLLFWFYALYAMRDGFKTRTDKKGNSSLAPLILDDIKFFTPLPLDKEEMEALRIAAYYASTTVFSRWVGCEYAAARAAELLSSFRRFEWQSSLDTVAELVKDKVLEPPFEMPSRSYWQLSGYKLPLSSLSTKSTEIRFMFLQTIDDPQLLGSHILSPEQADDLITTKNPAYV